MSLNQRFDRLMAIQAEKSLPPVASWHPERVGSIDIRIASDGTWYHEGSVITRKPLVALFASILRKDPEGFCLVTPAEKLAIRVDDAPFTAVDVEVTGTGTDQQLLFVTNVDEYVLADSSHPLWMAGTPERPRPYVRVRDGLDALILRSVYYRLVDVCRQTPDGFWLWSAGERFRLG